MGATGGRLGSFIRPPAAAGGGPTPRGAAMTDVLPGSARPERAEEVLSEGALAFLAALHRRFDDRRLKLLTARRRARERARRHGLDFLAETAAVRADASWRVAPAP